MNLTLDTDITRRLIDDATRICTTPAPTFAEAARAALVVSMFEALGLEAQTDSIGNVLCAVGPADDEALVFAAHLDTVFPAGQPIEIRHDEAAGRLHGPGIGDNSLGVAGLLELARTFAAATPERRIVLAATVGEEGLGDLRGAKHVLAHMRCRAFVAVEGAMIDTIKTAGVGSTRYRVTYRGPGGHSWGDRGTPSALHALITAAARLLAAPAPEGLARNIGRVSGGTSINTIAAEATLELDLRAEAPGALDTAAARAREILGAAPAGVSAEVEVIGQRPSGGLPADHPLIVSARRAREAVGLRPAQEGASSTDANAAYGAGVPAITVGLTTGANAHRVDEYIDLAPLSAGMAALTHLARALARG